MGVHNSLAVYTGILKRLVVDIAVAYVTPIEYARDINKIDARIRAEGFSFLTKTLPILGKAFDKALQGDTPFTAVGFRKEAHRTTPKFLWWLFERVFDGYGYVRSDADIDAIRHLRQIFQLLYKLEIPHNEASTKKVLSSFVDVNGELSKLSINKSDAVIKRARVFITRVLSGLSPRDIIPRHGPGAVATGERGGAKASFSRLYEDLEVYYPFTEYMHLSVSHTVDLLHQLEALEVRKTGTAKVVLVPKDSRGPRLISCEPLEKQWIQQGQCKALYRHIESHRLTRGHVNFTDQSVNRHLALESSKTRRYVTLDMKEASDRVSLQLVEQLYSGTEWYQALVASRSGETRLPNGTTVTLSTFAPMGSAVCFPIEALTFYALVVSTMVVHLQWPWRKALANVWVYGDDIICCTEVYSTVIQQLERFGLLFNRDKCCVSGFFRESCGCDAYKGVDVTPIRLRKTWNHRAPHDAVQLQSYVEFSNSMYARGYRDVASYVEILVEHLYGAIPYLEHQEVASWEYDLSGHILKRRKHTLSSKERRCAPGRVIGFDRPDVSPYPRNRRKGIAYRFNKHTHRLEVKGYSITPVRKHWNVIGWEALLHSLNCGPTGLPNGVHAVPHRSRIKRTWGLA